MTTFVTLGLLSSARSWMRRNSVVICRERSLAEGPNRLLNQSMQGARRIIAHPPKWSCYDPRDTHEQESDGDDRRWSRVARMARGRGDVESCDSGVGGRRAARDRIARRRAR